MTIFDKNEVKAYTLAYFDNDSLATDVWMSKYALRDKEGNFLELCPDDMFARIAKEFARIEQKYSNPMSEAEIYGLIRHFRFIVPQGGPLYGIGNNHGLMSLSNCVVVSPPRDSVSGIMNTGRDIANLYKYRCGVGNDLDNLRPCGMSVNNAAKTTTGAWSFADFFSYITGMIGQSGRRGALMLSMGIKHPDIEKFIDMKRTKGKVDNANVSVKLFNDFMNAVVEDREYMLSWNGYAERKVSAKLLFEKICKAACDEGEPGILFWDNILKSVPLQCYADVGFNHVGVNPCVTGDTVVDTNGGQKTVKELSDNKAVFYVQSYNEKTGLVEPKRATAFKTKDRAKILKIKTKDGKSLRLTSDHLVYTNRGWIKAGELTVEDKILSMRSNESVSPIYNVHGLENENEAIQLGIGKEQNSENQYITGNSVSECNKLVEPSGEPKSTSTVC